VPHPSSSTRPPALDASRIELSHNVAEDLDGPLALLLQSGELAFQIAAPHLFTGTFDRPEV